MQAVSVVRGVWWQKRYCQIVTVRAVIRRLNRPNLDGFLVTATAVCFDL